MSKAFTKEDTGQEEDIEVDEGPVIPKGTKNYITDRGAEKLRAELKSLLYDERPKLVQTISWAASNGDRSENGDYIYGKRKLREIDRRIRFLQKRLEAAEIINPENQKSDKVLFGATVYVEDEEGCKKMYRIVGIDETDVKRGHISWISPIGKALLQAKKGDVVSFRSPLKGEEELEIIEIKYVFFE